MESKVPHPLVAALAKIQGRDGISGVDLARRLEVNPSTITRLMSGDIAQPSLQIVRAMNEQFPELRSLCAQLLLISYDGEPNQKRLEPAEVPA